MKKALAIVSFSLQGSFTFVCLLQIALCLLYDNFSNAAVIDVTLYIMLLLSMLVFFSLFFVVLVCMGCNITKTVFSFKDRTHQRFLWLTWSIFSPVLCVACFWIACGLFVGVTGI